MFAAHWIRFARRGPLQFLLLLATFTAAPPNASADEPMSIAGLPGKTACVCVGPPLSANGPSRGALLITSSALPTASASIRSAMTFPSARQSSSTKPRVVAAQKRQRGLGAVVGGGGAI